MMNEYKKMNNEELVQAAGGLDVKVKLNCQTVLDKDYGKAVDSLQSGLTKFRSDPRSYYEDAKDRIGQLYNSDTVQNLGDALGDAAVTKATAVTNRLFSLSRRG